MYAKNILKHYLLYSVLTAGTLLFGQIHNDFFEQVCGSTAHDTIPQIFAPGFVSTQYHDDGPPVFSPDGKDMYFRIAGKPASIIFHSHLENGSWSNPQPIDFVKALFLAGFTSDGKILVFTGRVNEIIASSRKDLDIWIIEKKQSGWGKPVNLEAINTEFDEMASSISSDGTIYFSAEYPGSGFGKSDLYYSICNNGVYQKPINIGNPVNTGYGEVCPAVTPDGNTLVFTAVSYPQPGSTSPLNLYVSFKQKDNGWSKPENLTHLNSPIIDKFPGFSPDGRVLFWVSHRDNDITNPIKQWSCPDITFPSVNFSGADIYWIKSECIVKLNKKKP